MTFHEFRLAKVSVATLTFKDVMLLAETDAAGHVGNLFGGAGFLYALLEDSDDFADHVQDWRSFGFSPDFLTMMAEAQEDGYHYILFDLAGLVPRDMLATLKVELPAVPADITKQCMHCGGSRKEHRNRRCLPRKKGTSWESWTVAAYLEAVRQGEET